MGPTWAQYAQGRYKTGVPENYGDLPGNSVVKNPPANARDMGSTPGLGRSPGEGNGSLLQYSPHGQRNLVGYRPWGCKESDMTERLNNKQQHEQG